MISIILFLLVAVHVPFIAWRSVIYLLHLGIISTLYNVPKNTTGMIKLPLRSIPFLKVFIISYVWASISAILPALASTQNLTSQHLIIFSAHFMFIMSITLPFDIRDYKTDSETQLATIPRVIGINFTKLLAITALLLFHLLISAFVVQLYLLAFSLITALLIAFSAPNKKYFYFTFALDGTIILYYFMVVISFN